MVAITMFGRDRWTYIFAGGNLVYVLSVCEDDVLPVCVLTYIAKRE